MEETKKHWTNTADELKKALDQWTNLCGQEKQPSPDEKLQLEFKRLLTELQTQIQELSQK